MTNVAPLCPDRSPELTLYVFGSPPKRDIVAEFNRAFTVDQAIERFGLPYVKNPDGSYSYVPGAQS